MKATLRRWWRQLTSMRTALVLLLFLAIAAVPGSIWPQRNVSIEQVNQYVAQNPTLAPTLDRLWAFDVYSSPWFAAIYLLLFTSLVGCLVPRMREHIQALRRKPPEAPANMSFLPQHQKLSDDTRAADVAKHLKRRRFRVAVREHDDGTTTVSAQKGYLRDTGNLLFHFSLLGLLVGMAIGSLYGWSGNRILVAGEDGAFCNSLQQYDEYGLGPNIDPSDLEPFCLQLDSFKAEYLDNGQPTQYTANVRYGQNGEAPGDEYALEVNHPLSLDGANVFLLGHGYAPVISYTDRYGDTQTTTAPFLASDQQMTSSGAAVFPDSNYDPETGEQDDNAEVAFEGTFVPTTPDEPPFIFSESPRPNDPGLILTAYRGDTGLDNGQPQSVYEIDQGQVESGELEVVDKEPKKLAVGESWELDDGSSVKFEGFTDYATLEVRDDPGEIFVLIAAITVLAGLLPALTIKRRRLWVRVGDEGCVAGGLSRSEFDDFDDEFRALIAPFMPREAGDEAEKVGSKDGSRLLSGGCVQRHLRGRDRRVRSGDARFRRRIRVRACRRRNPRREAGTGDIGRRRRCSGR